MTSFLQHLCLTSFHIPRLLKLLKRARWNQRINQRTIRILKLPQLTMVPTSPKPRIPPLQPRIMTFQRPLITRLIALMHLLTRLG